jgi:hypothetical protein
VGFELLPGLNGDPPMKSIATVIALSIAAAVTAPAFAQTTTKTATTQAECEKRWRARSGTTRPRRAFRSKPACPHAAPWISRSRAPFSVRRLDPLSILKPGDVRLGSSKKKSRIASAFAGSMPESRSAFSRSVFDLSVSVGLHLCPGRRRQGHLDRAHGRACR